jgi:hypothetical protein
MKKFLLSLALVAFAASASMAQTANVSQPQVKKECCKDHKDGQKCDKPADQQCPDCKEKAAKQCDKAAMKHECKEGMKKCEKAQAAKHECKDHKDGKCDKPADQQCPDCKAKAAAKKN